MFPVLSLAVRPDLLVRLIGQLEQNGDARDLGELAVQLLEDWLARAAGGADEGAPAAPGGYVWKELFLPNGTQVRGPGSSTAYVRNGQLLYNGNPISPNRFAGQGANWTTHNAWKILMIQRPGDPGWTRAYQLRRAAQGKPPPGFVPHPDARPKQPAQPLKEPFRQHRDGKVPLVSDGPLPNRDAAAARARRPTSHDRWCAPLGDNPPAPPVPQHDPGEPVMIISRERRRHHARRVTDTIWDE